MPTPRRALVRQAADDWSCFFGGMNLDPVPAGSETAYIWSNNFNGGYYFSNTTQRFYRAVVAL